MDIKRLRVLSGINEGFDQDSRDDSKQSVKSVQIILDREDVNNPLHPFIFDEICDQLGLDPEVTGRLTMTVTSAEGEH
jgi:hypothetical protein